MGGSVSSSSDAWEYLGDLADLNSGLSGNYVFEGVEVPDSIAGQMESDPLVEVVDVEKGRFGFDEGTMILDFKIRKGVNNPDTWEWFEVFGDD